MTNKKIPKILFFKLHKLSLLKHPKKKNLLWLLILEIIMFLSLLQILFG